jgi:hypothetical protein
MRAALSSNPANAGFERPDAVLAVYFITDEDDCSARDVNLFSTNTAQFGALNSFRCPKFGVVCDDGAASPAEWDNLGPKSSCHPAPPDPLDDVMGAHQFLVDHKPPGQLVAGALIAPAEPVSVEMRAPQGLALAPACTFQGPVGQLKADPAVRLHAFLDAFENRGVSSSICTGDAGPALAGFGDLILRALGNSCLARPIRDADTAMPGLQPDCLVEDVLGNVVTPIPPCAPGAPLCFELVADPLLCAPPQNLKLQVRRPPGPPPDPQTVTRARCQIDP